jgi:quercetin dioxygenase-like cupin family protein
MEGSPSPYSIVGNVISNSKDEPTVNGAAVYPVAQVGTLLRGQKIVGPAAVAQLISKSQGLGLEMTPLRIENRTDREAEMHSAEDDIFYILDGAATFHLGGTLQDTWEYSPGNTAGHKQRNATEYKVAAGDIVVVPRGTAHRITCPDGFVEVLVIKRLADQSSDLAPTPAGKN